MTFIDSNIPMYLVGKDGPNKTDSRLVLERLILDRERLVTDAEVLQEILHRYRAIERSEAIQPAFDALLQVVDEVFPVERQDVEQAKNILLGRWPLSARDAIHISVMQRYGIEQIVTFDTDFDLVPGILRIPGVVGRD